MLAGKDIVCFANDWDADPTSKHQVMKILARSNRVLWVNSIGLRRPSATAQDASRIVKKVRQFFRGAVAVNGNMHVLTPLVIPFHGVPLVKAFNSWLVGRYVRRQAKKLGMNGFHLWTFMPTTAPLIRHLKPKKVVYYCVDEWSAFSFLDKELMENMEQRLIQQSDLVIASANALYESKRHLNPNTHLVPHGVDSEYFGLARAAETEIPAAIKNLPGPVIGFWGLIHEWIDLDLIRYAAEQRPHWSFVLVGKTGVDCSELKRLPNVHFTGKTSYESLAGYAKGFTAAIMPFKINRLTKNVNPIKLREYLAAGLPVVSTAMPEARAYGGLVRIAETPDAFVAELDAAVQDTSEAAARKRMEAVSKDTWVARVEHLSDLVEHTPNGGPRPSAGAPPSPPNGPASGGTAQSRPRAQPRSAPQTAPKQPAGAGAAQAAVTATTEGVRYRSLLLPLAVIGGLLLALYADIFRNLVQQWYDDPDYSHGFLVPLLSGYLIWERRKDLESLRVQPSWWGAATLGGGLLLLVMGMGGAELFLQRSSFILVLTGLVLLLLGRGFLKAMALPIMFLFFMVPLPAIVVNAVAFPLQLFAAKFASFCLFNAGIPVLREGNIIVLPGTRLEVAEACSGIRSLQALMALGCVVAYFSQTRPWKRWTLVLMAVPIAIAANAFRVSGTGILAHYWGTEAAEGFYHTFSGWLIFVAAMVLLVACSALLSRISRPRPVMPQMASHAVGR